MHANLDRVLAQEFVFEGGYAERPEEPGGAVNMGISMQTFVAWRLQHKLPQPAISDLRSLSREEAEAIYYGAYATTCGFDDLPSGLDYCVLDAAINDGVNWSLRELAIVLDVRVDRWPKARSIIAQVTSFRGIRDAIVLYCDDRLAHKRNDKGPGEWEKFHVGWTSRIERVRTDACAMAGS